VAAVVGREPGQRGQDAAARDGGEPLEDGPPGRRELHPPDAPIEAVANALHVPLLHELVADGHDRRGRDAELPRKLPPAGALQPPNGVHGMKLGHGQIELEEDLHDLRRKDGPDELEGLEDGFEVAGPPLQPTRPTRLRHP
jgi:hypothetical protein